ncbi:hypothetical protein Pfo_006922 [Paulownia fortunei]|nr:hypothetical protein Pfo_006922 [Paulownia fortunei]
MVMEIRLLPLAEIQPQPLIINTIIFFSSPNHSEGFSLSKTKRESSKMCPLRIILIFLSATLAGFFVLRNLKSPPEPEKDDVREETESTDAVPLSSKVCTAVEKGFWTCVDMASGKYLWRNLVSSSSSSTRKLCAD